MYCKWFVLLLWVIWTPGIQSQEVFERERAYEIQRDEESMPMAEEYNEPMVARDVSSEVSTTAVADKRTEAMGYDSVCPYCTDPEGSSGHTLDVILTEETRSTAEMIRFPPPRKKKASSSQEGLR